ncbi:MAG: NAD-binding protein, partial [Pseudomonadota bacterium]
MYSSSVDNLVKVGVFFCTCGHIMNDYFDMKALRKCAGTIPGVSYVDENSTLCTGRGLDWLRTKIAKSGCNRVVIAGCSPYGYESDFMNVLEEAGLNRYFLAIADLREGCAWVCQEKGDLEPRARQVLRSAVRRVSLAKPIEKVRVRVNPTALVIGAGLAGVQMALELHRMGIKPILIEQSAQAGRKNPSFLSPYTQGLDEREMFAARVKELHDKKIELLTSTTVKEVTGGAGAFRV